MQTTPVLRSTNKQRAGWQLVMAQWRIRDHLVLVAIEFETAVKLPSQYLIGMGARHSRERWEEAWLKQAELGSAKIVIETGKNEEIASGPNALTQPENGL